MLNTKEGSTAESVQAEVAIDATTKREVFQLCWQFVRKNGYSLSQALKTAWKNIKLKIAMRFKIVKFYFQKVDGSLREAYGTLCDKIIPAVAGTDTRKKNDTVQTFFDTEKNEWRCFKVANLVNVVINI